jgi:hypothetical protein
MALHSRYVNALKNIKHERLSREDYLKICWVSVLHNPLTIRDMHEPTPELCMMAARAEAGVNEGSPRYIHGY